MQQERRRAGRLAARGRRADLPAPPRPLPLRSHRRGLHGEKERQKLEAGARRRGAADRRRGAPGGAVAGQLAGAKPG